MSGSDDRRGRVAPRADLGETCAALLLVLAGAFGAHTPQGGDASFRAALACLGASACVDLVARKRKRLRALAELRSALEARRLPAHRSFPTRYEPSASPHDPR